MTYDYRRAMVQDIKDVIEDYDYSDCSDLDDAYEKLNDDLWINDSVTGNGSGSYTFSSEKAREYVAGNEELLVDAMEEFGSGPDQYKEALTNPEYADVTIRCYLLNEMIGIALEDPKVRRYIQSQIDGSNASPNRKPGTKSKKASVKKSAKGRK